MVTFINVKFGNKIGNRGNKIANKTANKQSNKTANKQSNKTNNSVQSVQSVQPVQPARRHTTLKNDFMGFLRTMALFPTARLLTASGVLAFTAIATLAPLRPAIAQTPSVTATSESASEAIAQNAPADNQDLRPLSQSASLLSVQGGQRLMEEAKSALSAQNYDLAVERLQQSRQVFNQLSNFYQELAASFSGIDTRIADSQRQQAIQTAQMRDEATYQLAVVHRAQNKPELAVPLLIQIIRSQNPTRDLGQRAYQQLFELGFVDAPFPRQGGGASSSSR